MEQFKKNDTQKSRVDLIEPKFILGIGNVLGFGASKYGENNWKQATDVDIQRVKGALLRHTLALQDGEILDPESGLPHTYHIGCNAMFLDYYNNRDEGLFAVNTEEYNTVAFSEDVDTVIKVDVTKAEIRPTAHELYIHEHFDTRVPYYTVHYGEYKGEVYSAEDLKAVSGHILSVEYTKVGTTKIRHLNITGGLSTTELRTLPSDIGRDELTVQVDRPTVISVTDKHIILADGTKLPIDEPSIYVFSRYNNSASTNEDSEPFITGATETHVLLSNGKELPIAPRGVFMADKDTI